MSCCVRVKKVTLLIVNAASFSKTFTLSTGMYEDVILLTLQLLYYRSWVSRIKYTHVKAGTWNTLDMEHTDSHGTHGHGTHGQPWNTRTAYSKSWLLLPIHTQQYQACSYHPKGLIRPPGCIYAHEIYYWMGPRMMNNNNRSFG